MEECCEQGLQSQINCLNDQVTILWDKVFGSQGREFIFTGNIGVPTTTGTDFPAVIARDKKEYAYGSGLINSLNPDGLFIVGDANYDYLSSRSLTPPYDFISYTGYDPISQETKITSGFSNLLIDKRVWPVMGDLDFYAAYVPQMMSQTYLRLFDYLPDAARYYSVYDDKSNTEFFVLSSGIGRKYATPGSSEDQVNVFVNDNVIGSAQHTWFVQRCTASPAKNKVVIFSDPFVSFTNTGYYGTRNIGPGNVSIGAPFANWDFTGVGVKLIINGHSGNSFHLQKGSMNIVNCSAFIRSRFMLTEIPTLVNPPYITTMYGSQGWSILYNSVLSVLNGSTPSPENVFQPLTGNYITPKNEIVKLTATKAGMKIEFISFNPYLGSMQQVIENSKVEYSFEIEANP